MLTKEQFNPDVLSCLANLSSDEVFTPPKLANEMLDLLPEELWSNKDARFLDPVCKTGVFLREIAKRLLDGLSDDIPDLQTRIDHIFKNQLYGVGITELTSLLARRSLYCSKQANGEKSVVNFQGPEGNILYERVEHTWKNGKCSYCGASEAENVFDDDLETHAYKFIHTENPEEIFDMKFDVIIGNPPYQMEDGGHGRSAGPVYHRFVQQAKKMNPRFLSLIIPARWYAGGKGLDEFRSDMLNDDRIRKLIDFENATDVFPGVDIAGGVCYFLWERDSRGECEVTNFYNGNPAQSTRALNEFPTFIRHSKAVPIIRKVQKREKNNPRRLSDRVSSRKPFGLPTNYPPKKEGIPCWFIQKYGLKFAAKEDVADENGYLNKWKVLVPPAPIAGQTDFSQPVAFYYESNTVIAKPGECCTESFIVAGAFATRSEALFFKSYLYTKIVRFLLLQTVVSQHVTKQKFIFIPDFEVYDREYSDEMLRKRWGITDEEWEFIDSKIR